MLDNDRARKFQHEGGLHETRVVDNWGGPARSGAAHPPHARRQAPTSKVPDTRSDLFSDRGGAQHSPLAFRPRITHGPAGREIRSEYWWTLRPPCETSDGPFGSVKAHASGRSQHPSWRNAKLVAASQVGLSGDFRASRPEPHHHPPPDKAKHHLAHYLVPPGWDQDAHEPPPRALRTHRASTVPVRPTLTTGYGTSAFRQSAPRATAGFFVAGIVRCRFAATPKETRKPRRPHRALPNLTSDIRPRSAQPSLVPIGGPSALCFPQAIGTAADDGAAGDASRREDAKWTSARQWPESRLLY